MVIHKRSCNVANALKSSYGDRILDVRWDILYDILFDAKIQIRGIDRTGMIHDVAEVLSSDMNIDIRSLQVSAHDDIFEGTIDLRVHNQEELIDIINRLKEIDKLQEVVSL